MGLRRRDWRGRRGRGRCGQASVPPEGVSCPALPKGPNVGARKSAPWFRETQEGDTGSGRNEVEASTFGQRARRMPEGRVVALAAAGPSRAVLGRWDLVMGGRRTGKGESEPSLGRSEWRHQSSSRRIWGQSRKPRAGHLVGSAAAPEMSGTCGHVRPPAKGTEGCHQLTFG